MTNSWHVKNVQNREKVLKDERQDAILQEKASHRRILDSKISAMDSLKRKSFQKNDMESYMGDSQHNLTDMLSKHKTPSEKEVERRHKVEDTFSIPMNRPSSKKECPWYNMQPREAAEIDSTRSEDPLLIIKSATNNTHRSEYGQKFKVDANDIHEPHAEDSSELDRLRSERLIREKREKERQTNFLRTNKSI